MEHLIEMGNLFSNIRFHIISQKYLDSVITSPNLSRVSLFHFMLENFVSFSSARERNVEDCRTAHWKQNRMKEKKTKENEMNIHGERRGLKFYSGSQEKRNLGQICTHDTSRSSIYMVMSILVMDNCFVVVERHRGSVIKNPVVPLITYILSKVIHY